MELKIGRNTYQITKDDVFIDNGVCVQLLSQSKEKSSWGRRPYPVLSKRAVKEISVFNRITKKQNYGLDVSVFSLEI